MRYQHYKIARSNETVEVVSNNLLSRIAIDPNICSGKPCIKGHRIWENHRRNPLCLSKYR